MKLLLLMLIFGAASLTSGCVNPPVYDECQISVGEKEYLEAAAKCLAASEPLPCLKNAWLMSIVADCRRQDSTEYERRGLGLDGLFGYSPEHRSNIMKWAKDQCNGRQGD